MNNKNTKKKNTAKKPSTKSPKSQKPKSTKKRTTQRKKEFPLDLMPSKNEHGQILLSPKLRKLWIDALRSGKYQQGKGTLCSIDNETGEKSFCCLGVLCEILKKKGFNLTSKQEKIEAFDNPVLNYCYLGEDANSTLPHPLGEDIGLSQSVQDKLAIMNDGQSQFETYITSNKGLDPDYFKPKSFEQIADYLETSDELYFGLRAIYPPNNNDQCFIPGFKFKFNYPTTYTSYPV